MKSMNRRKGFRTFVFDEGYTIEGPYTYTAISYDTTHGIIRIMVRSLGHLEVFAENYFKGTREEYLTKGRIYPI